MVPPVASVGMKMMPSILTSGASWMGFVIFSVSLICGLRFCNPFGKEAVAQTQS